MYNTHPLGFPGCRSCRRDKRDFGVLYLPNDFGAPQLTNDFEVPHLPNDFGVSYFPNDLGVLYLPNTFDVLHGFGVAYLPHESQPNGKQSQHY